MRSILFYNFLNTGFPLGSVLKLLDTLLRSIVQECIVSTIVPTVQIVSNSFQFVEYPQCAWHKAALKWKCKPSVI